MGFGLKLNFTASLSVVLVGWELACLMKECEGVEWNLS